MKAMNEEIEELNKTISQLEETEKQADFNPIATYGLKKRGTDEENSQNDIAHRKAFMDYVIKGTEITTDILQKANATTMTTDIGTVIPTTIMNQIIQKLRTSGQIFARIRKTNIKGGVSYPTSNVIPTASWVSEGTTAETQKKTTGSIIFNYYKVQCIVAISLEADTTSLDMFENGFVEDTSNAILVAIEKAVISGTGTGQPKGIFKETTAKIAEVAVADISKYTTYTGIYAKLERAYKGGAAWLFAQSDWDTYIVGMVDANGQPIARVTVGMDGIPVERLLGLPVVLVDDDYIEPFITAAVGSCFGALVNFEFYGFNSNMQISVKRYFEETTDTWNTKATALCDGKMLTTNGLVLLKKKA